MAKKKRKTSKRERHFAAQAATEVASSEPGVHPDATLGPDASFETPSTERWMARDSTSVGEEELEAPGAPAQSQWELVYRILSSRSLLWTVLTLVFIVFIGWIIVQDNAEGKLSDWSGIVWEVQKCAVFTALFIVLLAVLFAIQWLHRKVF
jgi:hypothetical protein